MLFPCSAQSGKMAGIHHPPDPQYCHDELLGHLHTDNPNRNLIICGDPQDILTQLNLLQMLNTPTRKNKMLDVFITNVPHFLRMVLYHRIPLKTKRKIVMPRNVRDRHNLEIDNLLKCHNWDNVY